MSYTPFSGHLRDLSRGQDGSDGIMSELALNYVLDQGGLGISGGRVIFPL